MGNVPQSCCQSSSNGHYYVSFPKEVCMNCPHKEECRVKEHKKVCSFTISLTAGYRAKAKRFMKTEEFSLLSRIRNGIETVPSVLRKIYHADRMPVHGISRNRLFFGCKVAAFNVRKLFSYRNGWGHYAQNPLFAEWYEEYDAYTANINPISPSKKEFVWNFQGANNLGQYKFIYSTPTSYFVSVHIYR